MGFRRGTTPPPDERSERIFAYVQERMREAERRRDWGFPDINVTWPPARRMDPFHRLRCEVASVRRELAHG